MSIIKYNKDDYQIDGMLANPGNYPEEVVGAAIEFMQSASREINEKKRILEQNLVSRMEKDEATKMVILDYQGNERVVTLMSGKVDCKAKNADEVYREKGFDPLEIGEFVYKPSWSKAKQARKIGGEKKKVIDNLFKAGNKYLKFD